MLGDSAYSLQEGSAAAMTSVFSTPRLFSILLLFLGVLMILGLATTISGILSCALQLVLLGSLHPTINCFCATAAGLSLVLVLLDPGAYSLDARFFGWRRIEIARRTPNPKP
jgi:hypothetical protein